MSDGLTISSFPATISILRYNKQKDIKETVTFVNSLDLIIWHGSPVQWRRPKVIENILVGKKTVSTLYWGLQYQIINEVGLLRGEKISFESAMLLKLKQDNIVELNDHHEFRLTTKGANRKKQLQSILPLAPITQPIDIDLNHFGQRLILAIQVASEFSYQNRSYYPSPTGLFDSLVVKNWFHNNKTNQLVQKINQTLTNFLQPLNSNLANFFISNFRGHNYSGLTNQQLADKYDIDLTFVIFVKNQLIWSFFLQVDEAGFSLWQPLSRSLGRPVISHSARQTYEISEQQNLSFADLARYRQVKTSTIKEHLLEVAIWLPVEKFDYQRFISAKIVTELHDIATDDLITMSYTQLSNKNEIDFFEFRLYQIYRSKRLET